MPPLRHALIISSPWIEGILAGDKTWELRRKNSRLRGQRIGLIRAGSPGWIVGTVVVREAIGPMTLKRLSTHPARARHRVPPSELRQRVGGWGGKAYAWVISDAAPLKSPLPYRYKTGQQDWVKLDPPIVLPSTTRSLAPPAPTKTPTPRPKRAAA